MRWTQREDDDCVPLPSWRLFLGGDSSYHITSCQGFMSWQPHYTPHTSHLTSSHIGNGDCPLFAGVLMEEHETPSSPVTFHHCQKWSGDKLIKSGPMEKSESDEKYKTWTYSLLEHTVFRQCKAWNVELKTDWCIKTLMISDNIPPESHILLWQICGRCSGVSDWLRRGQVMADWAAIGWSGSEWEMWGRGGEVTQPNI